MGETLKGQVAIVTGASGALGTSIVISLLAAGATVAGIDRSGAKTEPVAHSIQRYTANLTDPEDAGRAIATAAKELGKIDILVHVMGAFAGGTSVADTDDTTWNKMMDVNLNAAFYLLRAVVPVMRAAGHGRIIAIASRQAVQPAANVGAYSASKAALVSLVQTVALENKDKNIRANVILPGTMDTAANRAAMPNAHFDKWVKTSHVADVVVMLAGEAGTEITGAAIPIYGQDG